MGLNNLRKFVNTLEIRMIKYFASQRVVDSQLRTIGMEFFHRRAEENHYIQQSVDGGRETNALLGSYFLGLPCDQPHDIKKKFINFPANLITRGIPCHYPNTAFVIEILESAIPEKKLGSAITKLKADGFLFAIDDFTLDDGLGWFIKYVDIVKVCFKKNNRLDCKHIARTMDRTKCKLIAEKIESVEDFKIAKEAGYHYFQGYLFGKPVLNKIIDIPVLAATRADIDQFAIDCNIKIKKVEDLIARDIGFFIKFIRFIKMHVQCHDIHIRTIKQGLYYLGEDRIKKMIELIIAVKEHKETNIRDNPIAYEVNTADIIPNRSDLSLDEYLSMGLHYVETQYGINREEFMESLFLSERQKAVFRG